MKELKQLGWFGWSFISIIIVTLLGSTLFFFNIFDFSLSSIFNREDHESEQYAKETIEIVENLQATIGRDNKEVGLFISETHHFYNRTTGYGAINSIEWNEQRNRATEVITIIDDLLPTVDNDALENDLKQIRQLAEQVMNDKESTLIRDLHRMFHDLDIALNNYDGYDKIWNVTETLKVNE